MLPQNFFSFFWLGLWINASRYPLEGIVFSQFEAISTPVNAIPQSPFFYHLGCKVTDESCSGSMIDYAEFFFGGKFTASNRGLDVGVLVGWILLGKLENAILDVCTGDI